MAAFYASRCGEDTDDLLQEAWLGLLEALPELDLEVGQPEHYLIARARWRVLDTIKRERVRRCVPLDDLFDDIGCPSAPEEAASLACALDFVSNLKPVQREVLECLTGGLTWREAGERLGCASANIAYHVRRIRERYEEWAVDGCKA